MTVQVDIVSAEREIFSGEAEMVFAPAILGEVGIAPGHAPMLSRLGPGEVRLRLANSEESSFYVSGGLLEVQPKVVTILSDTAERAEDLDESLVFKAKEAREKCDYLRNRVLEITQRQNARLIDPVNQLRLIARKELLHGPRDPIHFNRKGYIAFAEAILPDVKILYSSKLIKPASKFNN